MGGGGGEASLVPQPQRRVPLPLTRPRTEARLMGRYRSIGFSYLTYIHTVLETRVLCPVIICFVDRTTTTERAEDRDYET